MDEIPNQIYLALREFLADIDDVVVVQGVDWKRVAEHTYHVTAFYLCEEDQENVKMTVVSMNPNPRGIASDMSELIRMDVGEIE